MIDVYNIDIQRLAEQSSAVYPIKYPVRSVVPAGGDAAGEIAIPNNTHFLCQRMTGRYSTLSDGADQGVNLLLLKITDNGRSLPLFQNFISADLIFTPGRVRSLGLAGDPSQQLFYPDEFVHVFYASTTILFEIRSQAITDDNFFEITMHGYNFVVDPNSGLPKFRV